MGDNLRWFKVWGTIVTDPKFLALPNEALGIWTRLGAVLVVHGNAGKLAITTAALEHLLRCKTDEVRKLPNVQVEESKNGHGELTVTMLNWHKYQVDTTMAERQKRSRIKRRGEKEKQKELEQEEEEEEEEEKEKRKTLSPLIPQGDGEYDEDFEEFWEVYPKKKGKGGAWKRWQQLSEQGVLPPLAEIIAAVNRQIEGDPEWYEERFIPNPAKWLEDRRWEDEF